MDQTRDETLAAIVLTRMRKGSTIFRAFANLNVLPSFTMRISRMALIPALKSNRENTKLSRVVIATTKASTALSGSFSNGRPFHHSLRMRDKRACKMAVAFHFNAELLIYTTTFASSLVFHRCPRRSMSTMKRKPQACSQALFHVAVALYMCIYKYKYIYIYIYTHIH